MTSWGNRMKGGEKWKAQSGVSPSWSIRGSPSPQMLIICGIESFANNHRTEAEFHETRGKRLARTHSELLGVLGGRAGVSGHQGLT